MVRTHKVPTRCVPRDAVREWPVAHIDGADESDEWDVAGVRAVIVEVDTIAEGAPAGQLHCWPTSVPRYLEVAALRIQPLQIYNKKLAIRIRSSWSVAHMATQMNLPRGTQHRGTSWANTTSLRSAHHFPWWV